MKIIRTRFAPSPTGEMHIGSLRTALYEYLFAKKNKGEFLLRIEDTDQSRYKEGSIKSILDSLEWTGLKYDGEIIFQSQRIHIYQKYAEQLVKEGKAYYCFCTSERLEKMRKKQQEKGELVMYDKDCRYLDRKEIEDNIKNKTPYVIRMKVPEEEISSGKDKPKHFRENSIKFKDLIIGNVEFYLYAIDDQILIKSDGYPTYHLANVVDDYEMKITHVIRAEEWLSSTPKHIILYNYFGWQIPKFAHIPLILAPDKSKLSKRHGATSVLEFKKLGYLPEALINYLALLGWNPGDDREIFSLQELEKEFSFEKVHQAGAIFDINKLDWMNGYYIRRMDLDKLTELCLPYLENAGVVTETQNFEYVKKVVSLEQERMKKLSDISELTDYFFKEPCYDKELLKWKKSDLKTAKERLKYLSDQLPQIPEENWTRNSIEDLVKSLIENHNLGTGETLWPMRVALTGKEKSPGPFEVAEVLGKEETLRRLKRSISKVK